MSGARSLLLLAALPFLMGAEVYRWVDANGVVNYSQIKPRGVAAEQIVTQQTSRRGAPAAASAGELGLTTEQRSLRRELQQQEQTRQADVAEVRAERCARAQRMLEQLSARGQVKVAEEDGGVRILPEPERQDRIRVAQDEIVENCVS